MWKVNRDGGKLNSEIETNNANTMHNGKADSSETHNPSSLVCLGIISGIGW